jgi:ferredoxin
MAINRVWIIEGCISCGLCTDLCPDVFKMEEIAVVIDGADYIKNEELVKESAESCPTEVIKYD